MQFKLFLLVKYKPDDAALEPRAGRPYLGLILF